MAKETYFQRKNPAVLFITRLELLLLPTWLYYFTNPLDQFSLVLPS